MAKKIIIAALILTASIITSYGCYTIIKHPSVMTPDNEQANEQTNEQTTKQTYDHKESDRDCVSCHQDYHQYPYGYYYGYYPDYYWNYPRWGSYYAYPWWWDYYYDNTAENGDSSRLQTGSKPSFRRGLEPPYSRDTTTLAPALPPPAFDPGGRTPVTGGSTGTATGGTVTNPPADKAKETTTKVENKKPSKHRGK